MELRRLELQHFGIFPQQVIELAGRGKLNLIYGPNEAGKSTARRALVKFLFGFQSKDDPDTSVFGRPKAAVIVHLVDGRSRQWRIKRLASRQKLQAVGDHDPLLPEDLDRLLYGLSLEDYEHVFCLDHALLREGGTEIRRARGRSGPVLLGAAAGILHIEQARAKLADRLDELFRPRAKKPKINRLLRHVDDQRRTAKENRLDIGHWREAKQRVDAAREKEQTLCRKKKELEDQREAVARDRLLLSLAQAYREKQRLLEQLADLPTVPESLCGNLRQLCAERRTLQERLSTLNEELEGHRRVLAQISQHYHESPLRALLAELPPEEIELLVGQAPSAQEAAESLHELAPSLRGLARELRTGLVRLGAAPEPFPLTLGRLEQLARAWPEDASTRYAQGQALQTAYARYEEVKRRRDQLEAELVACGPAPDAGELEQRRRQLATAVQKLDQLAEQLEEAGRCRRELAIQLVRLELPEQTAADDVVGLPVRIQARVRQLHEELLRIRTRQDEVREQTTRLETELKEPQRLIVRLRGSLQVTTEEQLHEARAKRDELLVQLEHKLTAPSPGTSADQIAEQLATASAVLEELKKQVRHVDLISDRLCESVRTAEQLAAAEHRYRELSQKIEQHAAELKKLKQREREILDEWCQYTRESIIPASLGLDQADEWLEVFRDAVRVAEQLQKAQRQIAQTATWLNSLLQELGEAALLDAESVTFLSVTQVRSALEGMRRTLDEEQERHARWRELHAQYRAADEQLEQAQAELEVARNKFESVCDELEKLLGPLGIGRPEGPNQLDELVGTVERLLRRWSDWKHMYDRFRRATVKLHEIRFDLLRIGEQDFLTRVLGPGKLTTRLALLHSAWQDVSKRRAEEGQHRRFVATLEAKVAEVTRNLDQVEETLATHAAELGLGDTSRLVDSIEQIAKKSRLDAELREKADQLARLAPGREIPQLVAELADRDVAELDAQAERLERELEELQQEILQAQREHARAEQELRLLERTEARAVIAEQEAEAKLAEALEAAQEYIVGRMALSLFDRLMEKYREHADRRFWQSASAFFRTMTCGRYSGIRVEPAGEEIVAVAAAESHEVRVEHLSDGTRDQLFLALRLAAIEHFVRTRGPVPVLFDDLLVNFDDSRAAATLELLAEFAGTTQVIFFTHHQHLLELAARSVPADRLHVTRMDGQPEHTAAVRRPRRRRRTKATQA